MVNVEIVNIYFTKFYFFAGYNLSPTALSVLLGRYGENGRVKFDDFVALCVRLRALTGKENFDLEHKNQSKHICFLCTNAERVLSTAIPINP